MFTIIKNGFVYSPEFQGKKNILICMDKIISVYKEEDGLLPLNIPCSLIHTIDAKKMIDVPGFIDQHMHFLGGGGKHGYASRAGVVEFENIVKFGVTTAISSLGVDSYLKSLSNLLVRSRELESKGLTTHILTGGFQLPLKSITNNIFDDLIYIDKVIGVGEIGIADDFGSQPTVGEIRRIAANTNVVASISEKPGKIIIHLGSGIRGFDLILEVLEKSNLSIQQFILTHINRNEKLLKKAIEFAKLGGIVDITTGISPELGLKDSIFPHDALQYLLDSSVPIENITLSSDSGGFRSFYEANGTNINSFLLSSGTLLNTIVKSIQEKKTDLSTVLKTITSNIARIWNLFSKGEIKPNRDADLIILDQFFNVQKAICKGKIVFDLDCAKDSC